MRSVPSLLIWVPAVVVAGAAVIYLFLALSSRRQPDLQMWHRLQLSSEFRARDGASVTDLGGYLEHERMVFEALETAIASSGSTEFPLGRYQPAGRNNPSTFPVDWNRTFELRPSEVRAGALLLHGLTDSPYSLRRIGEILRDRGFYVLGLRLPGHGTVPASIATASRADWRAAVRLGAAHTVRQVGKNRPFWIVGYSLGGALAVDHALAAIDDPNLDRPSRLVLLSPAVGITRFAAFARWHQPLSFLPLFEKFRWHTIYPEHDPFKYNSFPNNAAYQTHRLTREVRDRIEQIRLRGDAVALPRLLAFQSAADATVHTDAVVDDLFDVLGRADSELVVFDINRVSYMRAYFADDPTERLLQVCSPSGPPYRITLVTNADSSTSQVVARSWQAAAGQSSDEPLGLEWPEGVFSLTHVSVPFAADDPIYGDGSAGNPGWGVQLGRLEPRGERDLLAVPVELFTRLRYNPFFPYMERRLGELALD